MIVRYEGGSDVVPSVVSSKSVTPMGRGERDLDVYFLWKVSWRCVGSYKAFHQVEHRNKIWTLQGRGLEVCPSATSTPERWR